jgi:ATP-dependent helicase/nuclease subunit A
MVADGMAHAGAVAQECPGGTGLRLARGDWDALPAAGAPPAAAPLPAPPDLPPVGPLPPDAGAVLAPTALGGAKVLPGDTAPEEGEAALARGRLVHLLLDHLPRAAPADRPALAQALVAASEDRLLAGPTEDLVAGCLALAGAAHLAPLRDPAALTEVDVTAPVAALGGRRVRGTLDRLLIGSDRITAIDYKTNRLVPRTPGEVPEGILRQMGAYAAMLAAVWPGYAIEVAILWTATGVLMPLPRDLVMAALERAGADLTASGAPPRS